jgi:class 3 adenylate cyclase
MQLENVYGRLKAIRYLRGPMTFQSRKDLNQIVSTLRGMGILTNVDALSLHVSEGAGVEEALFSGVPERAAQLMSLLEHRFPKPTQGDDALLQWAVRDGVVLSVVVSDISDSARLCTQLGNVKWRETIDSFVTSARNLAGEKEGFFLKTNGDDALVVFRDAAFALDFAMELRSNAGHLLIAIHQGLHVGKVIVKTKDILGSDVNLAFRVAAHAKGRTIVVTDSFWQEIQRINSPAHDGLRWRKLSNVRLKSFDQRFTLWQLKQGQFK